MSVLGNKAAESMSSSPFFRDFKKQASFFLKEKIKTARLALTDVTPAELLTEEATNGNNPWAPDTKTMGMISRAAFEVDDYYRIVEILHTRLLRFDRTNWRVSYKALIILEHLLTHGPESVAEEFRSDRDAIHQMENFQYIDEKGFNWGLTVRKKSERVQTLLERGPLLKEERQKARKISRGIEGFGSFKSYTTSTKDSKPSFLRANSIYNENNDEDLKPIQILETPPLLKDIGSSFKENVMPEKMKKLESIRELNPLLGSENKKVSLVEEDMHPFNSDEQNSTASLL
ncbi:hypothetical protein ACHQM5_009815 [Ranunculus cassubicifolius]